MENGLLMQDVFPIENGDIPLLYVCLPQGISLSKPAFVRKDPYKPLSISWFMSRLFVVIVTHRLLFGPGPCGCAK